MAKAHGPRPPHFEEIVAILDAHYPKPAVPLENSDPYSLLVAVVLSAQCTDVRVNATTPKLWALAPTVFEMAQQSEAQILDIVRPCGLGPQKAKAILGLSRKLVEEHKGQVPNTREELQALPGVGRKSASVVLSHAFKIPAFAVDTHVHRLANRWGWSQSSNVLTVERDLCALFEPSQWELRHLQMVYFGRYECKAKAHDVALCPTCSLLLA